MKNAATKAMRAFFVRGRTRSVLYFSLGPEPDPSKMAKAVCLL